MHYRVHTLEHLGGLAIVGQVSQQRPDPQVLGGHDPIGGHHLVPVGQQFPHGDPPGAPAGAGYADSLRHGPRISRVPCPAAEQPWPPITFVIMTWVSGDTQVMITMAG